MVCTDVVFGERDQSPQKSLATRALPYEAFMVKFFDESRTAFRLQWSTVGESAWAGVTQLTFRRPLRRSLQPTAPAAEPRRSLRRSRRLILADSGGSAAPIDFDLRRRVIRARKNQNDLGSSGKPTTRWLHRW